MAVSSVRRLRSHPRRRATANRYVDVQWEVYVFSLNVSEIKRLAAGLAAIRIMGKVEVQRLEKGMLADLLSVCAGGDEAIIDDEADEADEAKYHAATGGRKDSFHGNTL